MIVKNYIEYLKNLSKFRLYFELICLVNLKHFHKEYSIIFSSDLNSKLELCENYILQIDEEIISSAYSDSSYLGLELVDKTLDLMYFTSLKFCENNDDLVFLTKTFFADDDFLENQQSDEIQSSNQKQEKSNLDENKYSEQISSIVEIFNNSNNSDNLFVCKVRGESMIESNINDGDMLLAEITNEILSNDLIIANLNNQLFVKKLEIKNKNKYLVSTNPDQITYKAYLIQESDKFEIKGKVISLIKKI